MIKKVTAAQAKAHLSALVAEAGYAGKRILIERRGRPIAAIVSTDDLERLEQQETTSERALGALALAGAWRDVGDDWVDDFVKGIYRARDMDMGRPVNLEA